MGQSPSQRRHPRSTLRAQAHASAHGDDSAGGEVIRHSLVPRNQPDLVTTQSALEQLVQTLGDAGQFAYDSEFIGELSYVPRLLRRRDDPPDPVELNLDRWGAWNPAAGFFHSASRSTTFVEIDHHLEHLRQQAVTWPMPAPTKSYEDAGLTRLPKPSTRGAFPQVLTARRTWRRFARAPVDLQAFSTLLHLTAGVQSWITARGEGRVPLKTAPSGGARHPIELYVLVRRPRAIVTWRGGTPR